MPTWAAPSTAAWPAWRPPPPDRAGTASSRRACWCRARRARGGPGRRAKPKSRSAARTSSARWFGPYVSASAAICCSSEPHDPWRRCALDDAGRRTARSRARAGHPPAGRPAARARHSAGAAMLVADFIRLKREGVVPDRDLLLMLEGDEETAGSCVQWLIERHRDLIDAEFALNTDAGGGVLRSGKPVSFTVQASEKVYATYLLEARDKGGHSSLPRPADDPTYPVAAALVRIVADDRIAITTTYTPIPSPPSPLRPEILRPIEQLVAARWPGVPVVPVMEAGASDGLFLRNAGIPTYGVSAVFEDPDDIRAHGKDERISAQSFYDATVYWYGMMKAFAGRAN